MRTLYVAHQNSTTREWIPVAILSEVVGGFELRYTLGARRCIGFSGLGRMTEFDQVYISKDIFPFFANRILSKSRPEYKSYMRWSGLSEDDLSDPVSILAVTGGLRATDAFEIFPAPQVVEGNISFDFFARGIRHLHPSILPLISEGLKGTELRMMLDAQNDKDPNAILLRADDPLAIIGYIPKYYCPGLKDLLKIDASKVSIKAKLISTDAPLDMRALCSVKATVPDGFDLLGLVQDLQPWTKEGIAMASEELLSRTNLDIPTHDN